MSQVASLPRLVDALASVRAELAALREEERVLSHAILAARPNGPVTGEAHVLHLRAVDDDWQRAEFAVSPLPLPQAEPIPTVETRAARWGRW